MKHRSKRARLLLALMVAGGLTASVGSTTWADFDGSPPPDSGETGRYVVVMDEVPLVTEFGPDGVNSAAARARSARLSATHAATLAAAGVDSDAVTTDFTAALNGFAVELTASQVDRIKSTDGVLMVLEDFLRQPQTDTSIDFLGLATGANAPHNVGVRGEGVIVGVIDSGIWPEHPSFADDGSYPSPGVVLDETVGDSCDFGNSAHNPNDADFECNNKLIGARQVLPTYRALIGADPDEFDSARDDDGHGTHTASTAAGNADVVAELYGSEVGQISGVAPRAHVIAYKALGNLGGFTSDLAAAIDLAVFDGVDVINYSVGGGAGGVGADEIAFLFAADAGVHVATSAGNSGPGAATLGDPGTKPWLTTVAASTESRFDEGRVRLAGGGQYKGASITGETPTLPLVDGESAGSELCIPGALDPGAVAGKIVLCRRGATARAAKSLAVLQAGGAGMVLYNNDDDDNLFTDSHFVPSVHVDNTDGLAIKAYIARSKKPQAGITTGYTASASGAPSVTYFSSRGPNPVTGDIIKPDLTAPGHQILAGYSPYPDPGSSQPGELFASISGTSMSSPHVAGVMALIDQVHPDWSAGAVKSALMTTAHQDVADSDRVSPAGPFDMGAGHVDVQQVNREGSPFLPGLVYEAGFLDHLGFLCDAFPEVLSNPAATCATLAAIGVPIVARDLNYPSIGVADLPGSVTVTRTVTSVDDGDRARNYRVQVDAPAGYEVTVTPDNFRVGPGESVTYQVTITNVSAPIGEWREGSLTWKSGGYEVRSPIAVRGSSLATPASVSGSGVDGSVTIPTRFGFTGSYTAAGHGLEPATVFSGTVDQDPDQTFSPSDLGNGAELHEVTTTGAALLRIKMPPDATEVDADLDLFVFGPAGNLVATSTAGGTDEEINLTLPGDGTYSIFVHGWSAPGGDSPYDLYTWVVSATPGGSLTIDSAPTTVTSGDTADIEASWTGATAGSWHLGAVSHSNDSGLLALTVVDVDNR